MLIHIEENEFEEEVLKSEKVTLVDFFATWCPPCQMLAPVLEELGEEDDRYDIVKMNVDDAEELAERYEITVVPTLIIFKGGEIIDTFTGAKSKEEVEKMMDKYL